MDKKTSELYPSQIPENNGYSQLLRAHSDRVRGYFDNLVVLQVTAQDKDFAQLAPTHIKQTRNGHWKPI